MKMDMRGSVEGRGRERQQQASDGPSLIKRGLCGDRRSQKGRLESTGMIRAPGEPTQGPSLLYSGHLAFAWGIFNCPLPLKLQASQQRAASCQRWAPGHSQRRQEQWRPRWRGQRMHLSPCPHGHPDQTLTLEGSSGRRSVA